MYIDYSFAKVITILGLSKMKAEKMNRGGSGPCLTEKPSMVVYEMKARQQLLQASATVPLDDDEPVIEQW